MTDPGHRDPDTLGHWEGDCYILDEPITMTDEDGRAHVMTRINFSQAQLPDDVTPSDVVHAMLNPVKIMTLTEPPPGSPLSTEPSADAFGPNE